MGSAGVLAARLRVFSMGTGDDDPEFDSVGGDEASARFFFGAGVAKGPGAGKLGGAPQ